MSLSAVCTSPQVDPFTNNDPLGAPNLSGPQNNDDMYAESFRGDTKAKPNQMAVCAGNLEDSLDARSAFVTESRWAGQRTNAGKPGPAIWTYFKGCGLFNVVLDEDTTSPEKSSMRETLVQSPSADPAEDDLARSESCYHLPAGIFDDVDRDAASPCAGPIQIGYGLGSPVNPPQSEEGAFCESPRGSSPDVDAVADVSDKRGWALRFLAQSPTGEQSPGLTGWTRLRAKAPRGLDVDKLHAMTPCDESGADYIVVCEDDAGDESEDDDDGESWRRENPLHCEISREEKEALVGNGDDDLEPPSA